MFRRLPIALTLFATLPVPVAAAPIVIKVASIAPDGSPWAAGLQEWKQIVETQSAGRVNVKLFIGGVLGDENETVLACKRGQIQAVGASTGSLASQVPEVNLLELPFLFDNGAEADYVIDRVIPDELNRYFSDRGFVVAFWSENGFRSFGGKMPVHKPEDLKGRKMRSQENPIHVANYRSYGASPVPIPTTEVLTSLQTGIVDGYDQTPLYTFAANWHTASKYYSVSDHIYQPAAIVFNRAAFEGWPEDIRKLLIDAGKKIAPPLRAQIREMTPILLEQLAAAGVVVNILTPAERAVFRKLADRVRADYIAGATANEKSLYALIQKGLGEYRSKATK